jgi:hypothetical protein
MWTMLAHSGHPGLKAGPQRKCSLTAASGIKQDSNQTLASLDDVRRCLVLLTA